jgi:hypothetical protein
MKIWKSVPSYWYDSRWYYFAKNHGRAYAVGATLAYLVGGGLNYLRCRITGKERGVNPGFLTSMISHDLRALLRRPVTSHSQERRGTVS